MKRKPTRTLDCLGIFCPEPVYMTRMTLDEMEVGEVLEVVADDPAAVGDITALVKNLEQEMLDVTIEGKVAKILIKKVK